MELYEYIMYNYGQKNDTAYNILNTIVSNFTDGDGVSDDIKRDIYRALGVSKGYTEYRAKDIASTLGVSKTAIKYNMQNMIEEKKLEIIKENSITFIRPIF